MALKNATHFVGIVTDGDLRRQLEKGADIYNLKTEDIMTKSPLTIDSSKLAIDALKIMKSKNISCLIVTNGDKAVGTIRLQDIVGVGIVG